jgi:hypothetical protein
VLVERGMLRGTDVMDVSGAMARGNRHQHTRRQGSLVWETTVAEQGWYKSMV